MLAYPRVLLIAPADSGLNTVPEHDELRNLGYDVWALTDNAVTADRIFSVVAHHRFDIVHFACHEPEPCPGDVEPALLLSCGDRLSMGSVFQIATNAGARCVFLNACTTIQIAQTLIDNHVPVVIATLRAMKDNVARHTAVTFYTQLAELGDLRAAYQASRPAGDGLYIFLTNGGYAQQIAAPILAKLDEFAVQFIGNQADHAAFEARLAGLHATMSSVGDMRRWVRNWGAIALAINLFIIAVLELLPRVR